MLIIKNHIWSQDRSWLQNHIIIPVVQSYRQDLAMDDEILPSLGDPKLEYGMGAVIHGEGAVTNLDFHR